MADEEVDWGVDEVSEVTPVDPITAAATAGDEDVLSLGGEEGMSF